jgi:hypothetical protein
VFHFAATRNNIWQSNKFKNCKPSHQTKKRSYFWKSANFATMEVTPQD